MQKKLSIGYPVLKLILNINYNVVDYLGSFEQLLFEIIASGPVDLEKIQKFFPVNPRFVAFIVDKHVAAGLITKNETGIYTLTLTGKDNLLSLSLVKERKTEVEIFYDPFLKRILRYEELVFTENQDFRIQLTKPSDDELMNDLPHFELYEYLEDHADDKFMSDKSINYIDLIESSKVNSCTLVLDVLNEPGRQFCAGFYSGTDPYPVTLETILGASFNSMWTVPQAFLEIITDLKNTQDTFYDALVHKLEFSTDAATQASLSGLAQDIVSYEIIVDRQHSVALKEMIRMTKKELFIASGWIKHKAFSNIQTLLIEKLKDPEINIHLLYGYKKDGNSSNDRCIEDILKLQKIYPNLHIYDVHQEFHCKAVIVDSRIVAIGSYNWLSNTGNSSKEWSAKFENPTMAEDFKQKLFVTAMKMAKSA